MWKKIGFFVAAEGARVSISWLWRLQVWRLKVWVRKKWAYQSSVDPSWSQLKAGKLAAPSATHPNLQHNYWQSSWIEQNVDRRMYGTKRRFLSSAKLILDPFYFKLTIVSPVTLWEAKSTLWRPVHLKKAMFCGKINLFQWYCYSADLRGKQRIGEFKLEEAIIAY